MTAPVTRYTREDYANAADLMEHGGWTQPERARIIAMLRQAAAEGQGETTVTQMLRGLLAATPTELTPSPVKETR